MSAPHTLKAGDVVTHPDWAPGETRVIERIAPFRRLSLRAGRARLVSDPLERIMILDRAACGDDGEPDFGWMEAGLEKVVGE